MPHDRNGLELQVGDVVLVPMRVQALMTGPDDGYCNVTLETVDGLPGNGLKAMLSAINTQQVIKIRRLADLLQR